MSDPRPADNRSHSPAHARPSVPPNRDEPPLRGTFASVLLLAAFIAVTWGGVFVLYVVRQ